MEAAPPSDNLYIADLPPGFDEPSLQQIFGEYGTVTQFKLLHNSGPGGKTAALVRFQSVEEASWLVENLDGNIPQGLNAPIIVRYADTPEMKAAKQGHAMATWQAAPPWGGMKGMGKGGCGGKGKVTTMRASPYPTYSASKGQSWSPGPVASPMGMKGMGGFKGGKAPSSPKGKGKGKCNIKTLINGLLEAQALPGCTDIDNDRNALYISGLPNDTQDIDLYRIFAPFGSIAPRGVRAMLHPDGTCQGFGFVNYMDSGAVQLAAATLHGTTMPGGQELTVKPKEPKKEKENGLNQGTSHSSLKIYLLGDLGPVCQLKPGAKFQVKADAGGDVLHLSQACLHQPTAGKNFLQVVDGATSYSIACLQKDKSEYASFDLFFRTGTCSFHNKGSSEMHLTGYFEPDGMPDDDEEEEEEEEESDEEAQCVVVCFFVAIVLWSSGFRSCAGLGTMGCGTSVQQEDIKPVTESEEKLEEPGTWASKPSQVDRPAVSTAAARDREAAKDPGAASDEAATGSGSLHKPVEHSVVVMDPDDGDDVEVIYEGKGTSSARDVPETPSIAAEGEAEDGQADVDLALAMVAGDDDPKPVLSKQLSKQQQEEAAKMAEHRKRFDNQRYQRGQSGSGETGPGAAPVPAISPQKESKAAHEIMGVNSSALTPRKAGLEECLPGGILEDDLPGQTTVPTRTHRNNHFDDDDEMLMKEILDSIDG
ncbi:elavl2 [Symbiodinium natans]|uniref:Elavl2 protein n=1 Tax=Symbiodinium natans TaxID=878477 RepID=A0A812KMX6_9DINO|nr:elavl2 [Symbiodinium natans]